MNSPWEDINKNSLVELIRRRLWHAISYLHKILPFTLINLLNCYFVVTFKNLWPQVNPITKGGDEKCV
jgi:hypothetical protein